MLAAASAALAVPAPSVAAGEQQSSLATPEAAAALPAAADPARGDEDPIAAAVQPPSVGDRQRGFVLFRPETVIDGSILPIEVRSPVACAQAEAEWLGREVRLRPEGEAWTALLPVPLGTAGTLRLVVRCGKRAVRFGVPVREGDYPESTLTVDPKFTKPPPRRAALEQENITRALAKASAEQLWSGPFVRPAKGVQTSPYGVRRTFNRKVASRHRGLDYNGAVGDPIFAANDGVVLLAAEDYYYTGSCVFLDHGNGLVTTYYHLSRIDVRTGDRVTRGQILGLVGASGRVTGPHLHFGVKLLGEYVNPADLLQLQPGLALSKTARLEP